MKTISLFIITLLTAALALAETPVSGVVEGKWTKDGSPYRVTGDLRVENAHTLRIEPEVDVVFEGPYTLTVEGRLLAGTKKRLGIEVNWKGRDERTVRFTTDLEKNPQGWGGIIFLKAGDENELTNCEISHARGGSNGGGVRCENSEVAITNCTFTDCAATGSGGAIAVIDGGAAITNCTLVNNRAGGSGGGVYVTNGELAITNCTIAMNAGGGIHL